MLAMPEPARAANTNVASCCVDDCAERHCQIADFECVDWLHLGTEDLTMTNGLCGMAVALAAEITCGRHVLRSEGGVVHDHGNSCLREVLSEEIDIVVREGVARTSAGNTAHMAA